MKKTIEIEVGTKIELLKPLEYYENIEEIIYTELLPVGREGEYLGKRKSRAINVHEELHPEYINSDNMWVTPMSIPGGHVVSVFKQNGWRCFFTFSDDELMDYIKIADQQKVEVE